MSCLPNSPSSAYGPISVMAKVAPRKSLTHHSASHYRIFYIILSWGLGSLENDAKCTSVRQVCYKNKGFLRQNSNSWEDWCLVCCLSCVSLFLPLPSEVIKCSTLVTISRRPTESDIFREERDPDNVSFNILLRWLKYLTRSVCLGSNQLGKISRTDS